MQLSLSEPAALRYTALDWNSQWSSSVILQLNHKEIVWFGGFHSCLKSCCGKKKTIFCGQVYHIAEISGEQCHQPISIWMATFWEIDKNAFLTESFVLSTWRCVPRVSGYCWRCCSRCCPRVSGSCWRCSPNYTTGVLHLWKEGFKFKSKNTV